MSHRKKARPDESSLRAKTRRDEFSLRVKTRPHEFSLRVKTRPHEFFLRMKSKIETELFYLLPVCSSACALVGRLEVPREAKRYGLTKIGLISLFPLSKFEIRLQCLILLVRCIQQAINMPYKLMKIQPVNHIAISCSIVNKVHRIIYDCAHSYFQGSKRCAT